MKKALEDNNDIGGKMISEGLLRAERRRDRRMAKLVRCSARVHEGGGGGRDDGKASGMVCRLIIALGGFVSMQVFTCVNRSNTF